MVGRFRGTFKDKTFTEIYNLELKADLSFCIGNWRRKWPDGGISGQGASQMSGNTIYLTRNVHPIDEITRSLQWKEKRLLVLNKNKLVLRDDSNSVLLKRQQSRQDETLSTLENIKACSGCHFICRSKYRMRCK